MSSKRGACDFRQNVSNLKVEDIILSAFLRFANYFPSKFNLQESGHANYGDLCLLQTCV